MKKLLITILLITHALAPALSQKNISNDEKSQRKEKIETLRVAFFTKKLELTPEESAPFFARQNDFEESISVLKKEYKHLRTKNDDDSVSDKEYALGVTQRADFKKKEIDLNSSFILDCFEILDAKRAITIPEIKKNFRKEILAKRNKTVRK